MNNKLNVSRCVLRASAIALVALSAPLAAQALIPGVNAPDPARWAQEDVTKQQKYTTAHKEAVNAQQASIDACASKMTNERPACIAEARANFNQDMAAIRRTYGVAN